MKSACEFRELSARGRIGGWNRRGYIGLVSARGDGMGQVRYTSQRSHEAIRRVVFENNEDEFSH